MVTNGSRVALVIGINEYEEDDINNLDKALNDAKAVAEKLTQFGFDVITGFDITSLEFDVLKDKYERSLKGADVGLFYFAGHGIEVDGENILLTKDSIIKSKVKYTIERTSIVLQKIIRVFSSMFSFLRRNLSATCHKLLILIK